MSFVFNAIPLLAELSEIMGVNDHRSCLSNTLGVSESCLNTYNSDNNHMLLSVLVKTIFEKISHKCLQIGKYQRNTYACYIRINVNNQKS